MQKEDEVDAYLREGKYDQPDRDARGQSKLVCDTTKERDRRTIASPSPTV